MNIIVPMWLIEILRYASAFILGAIVWAGWTAFKRNTFGG